MKSNSVRPETMDRSDSDEDREARWCAALAAMIECVDGNDLPRCLFEGLAELVSFSMTTIIVNRGRSRPLCIYDTFPTKAAKSGIANYINSTYVLNPFYRAHLQGLELGVYRIRDLAPDDYFSSGLSDVHKVIQMPDEEIGYKTENWPRGFVEVDIAVPVGDITIEIGLYNNVDDGGFSDRDIDILQAKTKVIGALVRKYWQLRSDNLAGGPRDASLDEVFENFGSTELSNRECEVIQLVLRGHSSESISINLDISITTVKTHRKRAYAKFGISSQSELFSLFLKTATTGLMQN